MDLHSIGVQIHRFDKDIGHGGDQIFMGAPDGVDPVGGILLYPYQLSQTFAAVSIVDLQAQQLVVKVGAFGEMSVGAADVKVLTF